MTLSHGHACALSFPQINATGFFRIVVDIHCKLSSGTGTPLNEPEQLDDAIITRHVP